MDEYWATRTGRWRHALQGVAVVSLSERLYQVIRADAEAMQLPAGAVLPAGERVARELAIPLQDVQAAYARLLTEGLLEERDDGRLSIAGDDRGRDVGDATQIRFEAALLRAVREAAARGLSSTEATGMFKAALVRMQGMESQPKSKE